MPVQLPVMAKYAVLALIAVLAACATTGGGDGAAKEQVAAATRAWIDAMGNHDQERVLALYAPDAVLWGTTSPTIRDNPKSIRQYFDFLPTAPAYYKGVLGEQHIRVYGIWRSTAAHTPLSARPLMQQGSQSAAQHDSRLSIETATGAG